MRDPIKDMYKAVFDDYTVRKDGGEWEAMESRIQKQNFLHFRWSQFNIFYAVSIITTLFLTTLMSGHYFYSNFIKEPLSEKTAVTKEIQENKIVPNVESSDLSSIQTEKNVKASKMVSVEHGMNLKNNVRPVIDKIQDENNIVTPNQKISEPSATAQQTTSEQPSKTPFIKVQKVVIVKQDTIHLVDTIKTKGRFWKKH
ncbi:MAG: hypothetical protein J7604_25355 [Sporocytophaga sp.]|uniref:hypothetical protein n=1 Tax=Sporocytophaga sp. TaxID=2231183 RepID=UPI001B1D1EB9|nr:hypothetical protein [Sporocytophaga sp.]MBO9703561.1 hypothetical protein [Sporocytophaga sp.]